MSRLFFVFFSVVMENRGPETDSGRFLWFLTCLWWGVCIVTEVWLCCVLCSAGSRRHVEVEGRVVHETLQLLRAHQDFTVIASVKQQPGNSGTVFSIHAEGKRYVTSAQEWHFSQCSSCGSTAVDSSSASGPVPCVAILFQWLDLKAPDGEW